MFEIELSVRDYECDLQGIVNNAVYQNYLEHARHEFLKSIGLNFVELHHEGKDLVLSRIEMDFKSPLRAGDRVVIRLKVERSGRLRLIFIQNLLRLPDEELVLKARATAVCLQNGRPTSPDEVNEALGNQSGN